MVVDWQTIGAAASMLLTGAVGFFTGRGKRKVDTAESAAEFGVIEMLRAEVGRLSSRLTAMENREGRLIRHVYRLEGLMRAKDIEPPAFEVDGDIIKMGGA